MIEFLMVRHNWLWAMYSAFAFMVVVPAALSIYFHRRMRLLSGGKRLRGVQRQLAPQHGNVAGNLANAAQIWRRLRSNEFGPEARRVVTRCNALLLAWAIVLAIWFGVLLYAEQKVNAQGGWPEAPAGRNLPPANPR